ncbi:MAG: hypothetical protein ACLSE8_15705 [Parasutterella sp.]
MVLNETTYTQKDIAVTVAMDGQAITFKDFAVSVSIVIRLSGVSKGFSCP